MGVAALHPLVDHDGDPNHVAGALLAFWSSWHSAMAMLSGKLARGRFLIIFVTLAGMIGWLVAVVWQLRLASTQGRIWSRTGYVSRAGEEGVFGACVFFYWIALIWGTGMLIGMLIFSIHEISN